MQLFLAAGKAQSRVLASPEASVWVKNLGDNGIELELTTWIRDADQGQSSLRSGILVDTWRAFREQGIEVPYPQRELRFAKLATSAPAQVPNVGE